MPRTSDPGAVRVDEPGVPQQCKETLVLSVNVTDHVQRVDSGHDAEVGRGLVVQVDGGGAQVCRAQRPVAKGHGAFARAREGRRMGPRDISLRLVEPRAARREYLQVAFLRGGRQPPHAQLSVPSGHPEPVLAVEPGLPGGGGGAEHQENRDDRNRTEGQQSGTLAHPRASRAAERDSVPEAADGVSEHEEPFGRRSGGRSDQNVPYRPRSTELKKLSIRSHTSSISSSVRPI